MNMGLSVTNCFRKTPFSRYIPVAPYPLKREQKVADAKIGWLSLSTVATNFDKTINLYGCQPGYSYD